MRTSAASLFVEKEGWKTVRSSSEKVDGGRVPGVQITERDLEVLGWIADQYAVRTDVIRWLLGNDRPLSDSRARAIVARWQKAGLAESQRLVRSRWRWRPPTLAMMT